MIYTWDKPTNQVNPNFSKLREALERIDCPIKLTNALSQGSKASLIVLTIFEVFLFVLVV